MKVLFTSVFEKGKGGGAGVVATELAQVFASNGFEVYKLIPANAYSQFEDESHVKVFTYKAATDGHVSIISLTITNIKKIFSILNLISPDIIHAHDCDPVAYIVQIWALLHKVPFVSTLHVLPSKALDFGIKDVMPKAIVKLGQRNVGSYYKEYLRGCSGVIALNEDIKEEILKTGYLGRTEVIPNGRYLAKYQNCKPADIIAQNKRIGFIGTLCERKNQLFLLEVLRNLPSSFELILIGEYLSEDYKLKIEEFVRKNQITSVEFLGQIPVEKVPSELEKMHVFVSASKIEVLSLAIIEALGSGTPVVAIENETTRSLMPNGKYVLPQEVTPKEFAQKILSLCNLNKRDFEYLCEESRKSVSMLDWQNIFLKTKDFYSQITQQKKVLDEDSKKFSINGFISRISNEKTRTRLRQLLSRKKDVKSKSSIFTINKKRLFFAGVVSSLSVLAYLLVKKGKKK
jgi:glycosyltransferase involved in cell wall biosynthesis